MSKVTLEFSIPHEARELHLAQNGGLYALVIGDMYNWVRKMSKYENVEIVAVDDIRLKLNELCDRYGVAVDNA